jgi:predicted Rossmann fold flavoprotein
MMSAAVASARGKKVLLIEKNTRLGEKLAISGGGRCNITNAEYDTRALLAHYGASADFLHSAFAQFGVQSAFDFFEERGLPLKVEALKRAFPASERAVDVVRTLVEALRARNVEVRTSTAITRIVVNNGNIEKVIAGREEFTATSYILATGGLSHPETGSTGDGFAWLQNLGHAVSKPTPTIVPLATKEAWVRELSGGSVEGVKITFAREALPGEKPKKFTKSGKVLFTHFGISGPTVLNSAGKVADLLHEGTVMANIDLYPLVDIGNLDKQITELFDDNKNKSVRNAMKELLPPGTAQVFVTLAGLDPEKKVHSITKEERRALAHFLKAIPLTIEGLMGYDRAVVADGGLALAEVDTRTMRSKIVGNLFITGDLLNISRPSGGYSLQLCWTTGYVAGSNV